MDEFDLGRLTDDDFERICKDLFERHLDLPFEIFARGKDGGIDLRHCDSQTGATTIIQCKHWIKSGRAKLVKHYETTEAAKVRQLAPDRYVIAASVDFTPASKTKLINSVGSEYLSADSIYGTKDIVSLLAKYPEVVRTHFRLWLSSTEVLQSVINQGILNRSADLLQDIEYSLRTYVPNSSLAVATSILEREHLCIIAGLPGIGKSTLGHVLAAKSLADGFEVVDATNLLTEIDTLAVSGRKQIFFVDDFLGQVSLNLAKADAASTQLDRLLRSAKREPNRRIVLTTREYLLAEARQKYDKLEYLAYSIVKCSVDIGSYTTEIRARVLYNHIFFSTMTAWQKSKFSTWSAFRPIVTHPGYSPRLIEHAFVEVERAGPKVDPVPIVMANLRNPSRLWDILFNDALTVEAVAYSVALFSCGERPLQESVDLAWASYMGLADGPETAAIRRKVLKRLDGTVIRTYRSGERRQVDFHNPSVRDYLAGYIADRPEVVRHILSSGVFLEQLESVWNLARDRYGTAVWLVLARSTELLDRALQRLVKQESSIRAGLYSQATRVRMLIEFAERLKSDVIVHLADDELSEHDSWVDLVSASEIVSLVRILKGVTVGNLRSYRSALAIAAEPIIVSEISSWEDVRFAESTAEDLDDMLPDGLMDAIEESKFQYATDIIAEWAVESEEDWPEYVDESELEEVLEYLNETDPSLDGYDQATSYLEALQARSAPPPANTKPLASPEQQSVNEMTAMFARFVER